MKLLTRPVPLVAFLGLIYAVPYVADALNERGFFVGGTVAAFVGMMVLAGLVGAYGARG